MNFRILMSFLLLAGVFCCPVASSGAPNVPEATPTTTPPPKRFNFADVRRRAEVLATQPFQETGTNLPDFLAKLNYDQYRDIRFRAEKTLWRDAGPVSYTHLDVYKRQPSNSPPRFQCRAALRCLQIAKPFMDELRA